MKSIEYDNGINFDSKADYLGKQVKSISDRPYQFLTISALRAELLQALNANNDALANSITKELQKRGDKPEPPIAFDDKSIGSTGGVKTVQKKLN